MTEDKAEKKAKRWRLWMIGGIFLLGFAGLIFQLGNLTIRQRQQFVQQSEEQQYRSIPVYAPRGVIYDRNMVPLVTNQQMSSLIVNYPYYKTPQVLDVLARTVNVPLADLQKQVQARLSVSDFYTPIRVKDDISPQEYTRIIELRDQLPGVDILSVPVRLYPYKDSAAHILGYVNQVTAEDLKSLNGQGYMGGDVIGRTGIEATYEKYLRGKNGAERVAVNSRGQPVGISETLPPSPGNSLVLTIDQKLQDVAEKTLDWDMWRIRNTIIGDGPQVHAKAGAVVAMDVKTGAILAMASRPAFDLNSFAKGITQAEYERLMDPILTPEVNRPIQTAYQPGSTWKMLTAYAALSNGVVTTTDKVFSGKVYEPTGQHDWVQSGWGWVDVRNALRYSSDIFFYEMGRRLGVDRLVAAAKEFGFGQKTGVDLGGEVPGMLPDAATRAKLFDAAGNQWTLGDTCSSAIGQILNVTPLQLCRYVAALGSNGKVMKPYLVQRVIDPNGKTIQEFGPQQVGQVNIESQFLQAIYDGMHLVDSAGGTSDYAIYPLPGVYTGGKTGSAEYPPQDDYGFFVSLVPLNDPQIAVAVAIEQAMHGSNTSAVARAIEAAYLHVQLPKHDPAVIPPGFPTDMTATKQMYRIVGNGQ